jgi:hypothetical protein
MSHPAALDREEVASERNPAFSGLTNAEAGARSLLNRGGWRRRILLETLAA